MTSGLHGFDQVAWLNPDTAKSEQDITVELKPMDCPKHVTVHRTDDHPFIDKLHCVGDVVNAKYCRPPGRQKTRFDHLTGGVETQSVDARFE